MMKIYYTIYLAIASFILISCEQVIDLQLEESDIDLIVVEGNITTLSDPEVRITRTLPSSEQGDIPIVNGAQVEITDNEGRKVTLQEIGESGYYTVANGTSYKGEVGMEYTININVDGVQITGSDKIDSVEEIDTMYVHPSTFDEQFFAVYASSKETPGLGDNYRWDIFVNNELITIGEDMIVFDDRFADGSTFEEVEIYIDFADPNDPEDRMMNLNDTIQARQLSVSSKIYDFYFQIQSQSGNQGFASLFSVPPANINGNLVGSDGKRVLGIFSAHAESKSMPFVITEEVESKLQKD